MYANKYAKNRPQKKYAKKNIKKLSCSFNKEFVDQFRDACKSLDITQSDVIRQAMQVTIDKANKKTGK